MKAERTDRRARWRTAETQADAAPRITEQRGIGRRLLDGVNRLIAASSLVPDHAVLDVRDFAWTGDLRTGWRAIRDEALATALVSQLVPGKGRSYLLWDHGQALNENLARCPETADLVEQVPGLHTAFFSILTPGTHVPQQRGLTKGLITCHLGLIIPRDGDARMRIEDRVLRWAEGETLLFDDTREHEKWNATSGTRIVLVIQFRRPLRNPGRWVANAMLKLRPRRS